MRTLFKLLFFVMLAIIGGALLAVPANYLLAPFTDIPFHKLISNIIQFCGLISVFLFLKSCNVLNVQSAGLAFDPSLFKRDLLTGLMAGIGILIVVESLLLGLGIHQVEPFLDISLATIGIEITKAILTGFLVGIIEEILFRGAMLGGLLAKISTWSAVVVSSLVYAAVHFLKFRALPEGAEIEWFTGLQMIPDALFRFRDPVIIDFFLSLFAFGVLLALVRVKKGNIIQCIGLHTGVVMSIKIINYLTDYSPGSNYDFLVNAYNHMFGYLTFILLLAINLFYYLHPFKKAA